MKRSALLVAGLIGTSLAMAESTSFVGIQKAVGGSAIVEFSDGGEYVYEAPQRDNRPSTKPFLTGQVPRQTYRYFSLAEEQALLAFKSKKLAAQVKSEVVASRKKHVAKTQHFDWPRVVLKDNQVCVPELADADGSEWKEHLTCITEKGE